MMSTWLQVGVLHPLSHAKDSFRIPLKGDYSLFSFVQTITPPVEDIANLFRIEACCRGGCPEVLQEGFMMAML